MSELKELQRTLDHDEKLKDFLFSKSNDRVFAAAQFEEDEKQKGKRAAEEKVGLVVVAFFHSTYIKKLQGSQ